MIRQELLKIVRRRGMFWTATAITLLAVLVFLVVNAVVKESRPEDYVGGADLLEGALGAVAFVAFVFGVMIGAQAGAYDQEHGIFRYLALTGTSKLRLYLVRVPAVLVAILLFALPAVLVAVAAAFAFPLEGDPDVTGADLTRELWSVYVQGFVYGLISFAVGALLRSTGAAIVVAFILDIGAFSLLALLDRVSETLGDLVVQEAIARVTGEAEGSLGLAIAALVGWVGAFLAAGAARTVRAEY